MANVVTITVTVGSVPAASLGQTPALAIATEAAQHVSNSLGGAAATVSVTTN